MGKFQQLPQQPLWYKRREAASLMPTEVDSRKLAGSSSIKEMSPGKSGGGRVHVSLLHDGDASGLTNAKLFSDK